MIVRLVLAALLCVVCSSASYANPRVSSHPRHTAYGGVGNADIRPGCSDPVMRPCYPGGAASSRRGRVTLRRAERRGTSPTVRKFRTVQNTEKTRHFVHLPENPAIKRMGNGLRRVMAEGAGRIVAHPFGCPRRAFCGCGAAVRVFGKPIRSLWLAANWFRFPRTSPAPGTVAVRRHHVFVLEHHIGGSTWMVWDANSGRGRTRIHARSIAGYVIVQPTGGA